jgi:hypothetical protein
MSEHNRCLSTRRAGLPVTAMTLSSLELVEVAGDMDEEHVDTRGEVDQISQPPGLRENVIADDITSH